MNRSAVLKFLYLIKAEYIEELRKLKHEQMFTTQSYRDYDMLLEYSKEKEKVSAEYKTKVYIWKQNRKYFSAKLYELKNKIKEKDRDITLIGCAIRTIKNV